MHDWFAFDVSVSNQSQHAFWKDDSISDALIFVTADATWGDGDANYGPHRYIISAYVRRSPQYAGDLSYFLEDQYMTVRYYDLDEK